MLNEKGRRITMKINFNQEILAIDGKPIPEGVGKNVTLLSICQQALQMMGKDDQNLPAAKKVDRYNLLLRITNQSPDVELAAEEVAMLKELVGKLFTVIVVGQALAMLENKPTGIEKSKEQKEETKTTETKEVVKEG